MRCLLFLLGTALILPILAPVTQAQVKPDNVTIQLNMPEAYDDSDENLSTLRRFCVALPPSETYLRKGEGISNVIQSIYGVTRADNTHEIYDLLLETILDLNGLSEPEQAVDGSLFVPTVPPRKVTTKNTQERNLELANSGSSSQFVRSLADVRALYASLHWPRELYPLSAQDPIDNGQNVDNSAAVPRQPVSEELAKPFPDSRKTNGDEPTISIDTEVSADTARNLESDSLTTDAVDIADFPMTVVFTQSPCEELDVKVEPLRYLTIDEQSELRTILQTEAQRDVCLFILDSGWPSPSAYSESLSALADIVQAARSRLRCKKLVKLQWPQIYPGDPVIKHCAKIEEALQDLRALDTNKHVKVIYVPISLDQQADPIIEEILVVHEIARRMGANAGNVNVPLQVEKKARDWAKGVIKDIRQRAEEERIQDRSGTFNPSETPEGNRAISDEAILNAVLTLGTWYGRSRPESPGADNPPQTANFYNLSWLVRENMLEPILDNADPGLIVVSAGNDSGQNVNAVHLDLAQRCNDGAKVLTVINMPRRGKVDKSSNIIDKAVLNIDGYAVGFDGYLKSGECGTSFSAPRVAWLLAVKEALRVPSYIPYVWCGNLKSIIRASLGQNLQNESLWFNVTKVLNLRGKEPVSNNASSTGGAYDN